MLLSQIGEKVGNTYKSVHQANPYTEIEFCTEGVLAFRMARHMGKYLFGGTKDGDSRGPSSIWCYYNRRSPHSEYYDWHKSVVYKGSFPTQLR